jgi:GrpB-like predicted nucleotidyltransferase (UPF0157 family)
VNEPTAPLSLDQPLSARLQAAGVDVEMPIEPAAAWRRLHDAEGPRASLLDRYALEAVALGVTVDDLDRELRLALAHEVFTVRDPAFSILPSSHRVVIDLIEVVPSEPAWPDRFEWWRTRLAEALGDTALRIDHIGSTSVPGLPAKPVIDIQVSVPDVDDEAAYVTQIEGLGVALRTRETAHRYFRPGGGAIRDVQIHVCAAGSAWERMHLLFRDYLRGNPSVAEAYAALKQRLAVTFREDRLGYNEAKSGWILDTLADAQTWATATGWHL